MRRSLEAISLGALALQFWITWRAFYGPLPLPARIATHFDLAGNPNGWGSPSALLLLPAVAVALYLLISAVSLFPSVFNFPVRVTPENRPRLEMLAIQMIAWLKAELVCLFTWIQGAAIEAARRGHGGLAPALFPVALAAIFGTIGWYLMAMRRTARPGAGS
jgi:hypothetical protein